MRAICSKLRCHMTSGLRCFSSIVSADHQLYPPTLVSKSALSHQYRRSKSSIWRLALPQWVDFLWISVEHFYWAHRLSRSFIRKIFYLLWISLFPRRSPHSVDHERPQFLQRCLQLTDCSDAGNATSSCPIVPSIIQITIHGQLWDDDWSRIPPLKGTRIWQERQMDVFAKPWMPRTILLGWRGLFMGCVLQNLQLWPCSGTRALHKLHGWRTPECEWPSSATHSSQISRRAHERVAPIGRWAQTTGGGKKRWRKVKHIFAEHKLGRAVDICWVILCTL